MKYALLFLLLFPAALFSQREAVSDSSYLKWENNAWYRVTTVTYDNDDINAYQTFIGDTTALYNQAVDGIRNRTSSMATDANYTSTFPKSLRTILNESDEILAKAGISPSDSIEVKDAEPFLQTGWKIRIGGTETDITFNQNAAKRLRYQNVTTTNRNTDLLGSVIRLRDFPNTGTTTDLYRTPNGKRWTNLDRSVQLIPPGGSSANR